MNVIWIQDGKKFTLVCSFLIPAILFEIFTATNPLVAAGWGASLPIIGWFTIKSAIGWSWKRASQKAQTRKEHLFGT